MYNFSITILNILCVATIIYLVNNEANLVPIGPPELAVAIEASENSVKSVTNSTKAQENSEPRRDEFSKKEVQFLEFINQNWPYENSTSCYKSEVWYTNNRKPIVQNYSYKGAVI